MLAEILGNLLNRRHVLADHLARLFRDFLAVEFALRHVLNDRTDRASGGNGKYADIENAVAVNLIEAFEITGPSRKRAFEKIGELNLRYQQQEMKPREIMKVEVALRERKIALEDREAIQSYMSAFLEEVKDKPWYSYYRNLFGSYFALKAEVPEIVTSMRIISEELVADPKPIDRLITLRRCPA